MKIQLKRIGNSRGFTVPASVLEKLGWNDQTQIDLEVSDSGLHLSKGIPSLEEIVASIPKGYREEEISTGSPVGKEAED